MGKFGSGEAGRKTIVTFINGRTDAHVEREVFSPAHLFGLLSDGAGWLRRREEGEARKSALRQLLAERQSR